MRPGPSGPLGRLAVHGMRPTPNEEPAAGLGTLLGGRSPHAVHGLTSESPSKAPERRRVRAASSQGASGARPRSPRRRLVSAVDVRAGQWALTTRSTPQPRRPTMTTTMDRPTAIDDAELELPGRVLAGRELPLGRADLPARQPAAAGAAAAPSTSSRACSATGARRPGLNFVYVHLNRVIRAARPRRDLRRRAGARRPGARRQRLPRGHLHRGLPAIIARTRTGMQRLFRQFSFPGGIPSHVAPETPGLDPRRRRAGLRAQPRLRRGVRQPGPARRAASSATARPRPGRWPPAGTPTSSSNPAHDGAVLPILHLNGYKIANPTILARIPESELRGPDARLRLRAVLRRGRRPRRRCTS